MNSQQSWFSNGLASCFDPPSDGNEPDPSALGTNHSGGTPMDYVFGGNAAHQNSPMNGPLPVSDTQSIGCSNPSLHPLPSNPSVQSIFYHPNSQQTVSHYSGSPNNPSSPAGTKSQLHSAKLAPTDKAPSRAWCRSCNNTSSMRGQRGITKSTLPSSHHQDQKWQRGYHGMSQKFRMSKETITTLEKEKAALEKTVATLVNTNATLATANIKWKDDCRRLQEKLSSSQRRDVALSRFKEKYNEYKEEP
ncbi:hypothetical protein L204_105259 [Cryptococcus depauperatus]|nr:hypothetical protein L204_03911 [Cryptococcus depauperatus CBS 7855]